MNCRKEAISSSMVSTSPKFDLRSEDKISFNSQIPWLAALDKENSSLSPGLGDRNKIKSPRSVSSSSLESDALVQSRDDDHYTPFSLSPSRMKPNSKTFEFSKSETESRSPNHESFKFQNDSFGTPLPVPLDKRESQPSPTRQGRSGGSVVKRNSRFSEAKIAKQKDPSSENRDAKDEQIRFSIEDIEKEPYETSSARPTRKESSPKNGKPFFKKRLTAVLTPTQLELLDDKVIKSSRGKTRHRSFSNNAVKPGVRRSKLLQRISNIAARGSIAAAPGEADNPAVIFKQLLKKVNPTSLQKAEKEMKRRYIRRFTRCVTQAIKVPFQVLTPDSFFAVFWTLFILVLVVYDLFVKPFQISFFEDNRKNEFLQQSAAVCGALFTLDIVFNFRTAFYDKGVLVESSSIIFKNYLRVNFIWDSIAVLADFISLAYAEDATFYIKLVSIIRVRKLLILTTRAEDFLTISKPTAAALKLFKLWATIMIVAHWLACIFHFIAISNKTSDTWLSVAGLTDDKIVVRYIYAFYWSTATMLTVGYGDVVPISIAERVYTIISMMIACVVFGYSLNTVANILKEMSYEKDQRREKISTVKHYMNQKNLGHNIQTRVKNYIQYIIDSRALYKPDEEEFLELLSQGLKDEIVTEVNGKIIASSAIFHLNFSHKASLNLAKFMKERFLAPEEILFTEGDRSDCSIYFLAYGKIQLFHKVKKFNVLEKGSQFGEVAFFSGQARTASAKSLFFSNLYSLSRDVTLENITAVPSDFEMFHLIKDSINIEQTYTHLEIKCFSCGEKGHLARDCDKIHYVARKQDIIENYLKREAIFAKKWKRKRRERFSARSNIPKMAETAEMIQEDYSDYTISDEEVSQDSLDEILERNLVVLPRAEITDFNARKLERKNKSTRYSAIALMGEIITPHYMHHHQPGQTRGSYTSHTGTKEDNMTGPDHRPSTKYMGQGLQEFVFFSIDKVENFEVYYPQYNIRTMILRFEKERFQNMLRGDSGTAKALVLKNFGSLMKRVSQGGTKSPLFFSSLQKQTTIQRGKRKAVEKPVDSFAHSGLNKQMQEAITRKKTLNKNSRKTKNFEEASSGAYELAPGSPDTFNKGGFDFAMDDDGEQDTFKNNRREDEATMSRREIFEDRKGGKTKIQITRLGTLKPKTLSQLKMSNSDITSHILPSSPSRSDQQLGSIATPSVNTPAKINSRNSSKKGSLFQLVQTKNSLDERIPLDVNLAPAGLNNSNLEQQLIYAMVKEGRTESESLTKFGRSYSLEKFDDMKKQINKLNIPKVVRTLLQPQQISHTHVNPKTAHFGI